MIHVNLHKLPYVHIKMLPSGTFFPPLVTFGIIVQKKGAKNMTKHGLEGASVA